MEKTEPILSDSCHGMNDIKVYKKTGEEKT